MPNIVRVLRCLFPEGEPSVRCVCPGFPNEVGAQQLSLSSGRATGMLKKLSERLRNVSCAQELSFYVHYFVFCHILWII